MTGFFSEKKSVERGLSLRGREPAARPLGKPEDRNNTRRAEEGEKKEEEEEKKVSTFMK